MIRYSQVMKEQMVSKMLAPNGPSALKLSVETGIAQPTLSKWKRTIGVRPVVAKKQKREWTLQEKSQALFEVLSLTENERGAWLRRNGVHSEELAQWQIEITTQLSQLQPQKRGRGRPKKDPTLAEAEKEIKVLRKDLQRKNAALAEQTALVILQKKAEAIWAAREDEE